MASVWLFGHVCILTYVHADGRKFIHLCDKHLFDALYHIYMHVNDYIMQDDGLECFDIYDVIFYLGLSQYVYFAMA